MPDAAIMWAVVEYGRPKPSLTVCRANGGVPDSEGPTLYSRAEFERFVTELSAAADRVWPPEPVAPYPSFPLGIATKEGADGRIPVGYAGDFGDLTRAGCEPVRADGGVVPKAAYPELYAALTAAYPKYESDDETFELPDFRGISVTEHKPE